jgi:hypothetical protein
MVSTLLLCSGLLAWAAPTDADRTAYDAAKAQAGRDADAHVKLALWCERHGMTAERAKHLALAVLNDPKHAMARALMGMVQFEGGWKRPEDVAARVKADAELAAKRAAYDTKRARAPQTADAQWKLALWCEENGLKPEATAHFWAVVRLEPGRDAAWKRLGYKKQANRWVTDAQLAAGKAERALQEKADRRWRPTLEKWRGWLGDKGKRRAEAEQGLAAVTDPRAVPAVWAVFAVGGEARQRTAVRVLGQIDAPAATRDLALLTLFSPSPDVRRRAAETLNRRDPRDFAGLLIAFLREPIKYQVRPVAGPGSRGELFVEGSTANVKRLYSPPAAPNVPVQQGDSLGFDANGLPVLAHPFTMTYGISFGASGVTPSQPDENALAQRLGDLLAHSGLNAAQSHQLAQSVAHTAAQSQVPVINVGSLRGVEDGSYTIAPAVTEIPIGAMILQSQLAARVAQAKLENDVQSIEQYNAPIQQLNERLLTILKRTTGQDFGTDRDAWRKWFVDLLGYADAPQQASPDKPLVVEDVPLGVQPLAAPVTFVDKPTAIVSVGHSCFGRGTPVRTLNGERPIESVLPGDQVLTQDPRSGVLRYEPVLRAIHNPPSPTLAVKLGEETVIVTGIHRFWKAGHGWVMARDLKPGDAVRTLGGLSRVVAVDSAAVQPVFNLEVASGQSFFVGAQGALVHDNSRVEAVPEPFDAVGQLPRAEAGAE